MTTYIIPLVSVIRLAKNKGFFLKNELKLEIILITVRSVSVSDT